MIVRKLFGETMKKIFSLLISIGMCFSLLVGCNLFSVNPDKYYSQVVATAGKYSFTMSDLLEAYDLYGSNYTDNGSSYEEAIKSSLDDMIDKKLLIEYIKENNIVTLTEEDYNDIKLTVYESIQSSLTSFEDQIKVERGLKEEDDDDDDDETETDYVSKFVVDQEKLNTTGVFDIKRIVDTDPNYGVDPGEFVQLVDIAYPDISEEAMRRYVKTLQSKARQYNRSEKEDDVKKYEYDRLTRLYTENKYITKLQENYFQDLDVVKQNVVNEYVTKYAEDYVTYSNNKYLYNTTMSGYASSYTGDIYYHPEVNYMSVAHILIKYDTATSAKIAQLDNKLKQNDPEYTQEDYDNDVRKLSESMQVSYTENGTTKVATAKEIFDRVTNELNNIDRDDIVARTKKFYKLMEIFNQDTGIDDCEYGYLIPLNIEEDDDGNSINGASDSMIEEFANDSRALHEARAEGGNISSELVLGSYGYHIIFNMGELKNLFTVEQIRNYEQYFDEIWSTLFKTNEHVNTNKTKFDKIYDDLGDSDTSLFNTYASNLTASAKSGVEIKKYEGRYKGLWS